MLVRSLAPSFIVLALASPAAAASYTATLAVPATERIIARDITWQCGADACQGSTLESRPLVLCESLAGRAGKVDSFLADGRAFSAAELAKCNAFAKAPAANVAASHE
jgi:hypothetical protein